MPNEALICRKKVQKGKTTEAGKDSSFAVAVSASRRTRWSVGRWIKSGLLLLIRMYQLIISPVMPSSCRFYPTCSVYAYQSIERHGILKGCALALKRLAKCHPFGGQGYDPVP